MGSLSDIEWNEHMKAQEKVQEEANLTENALQLLHERYLEPNETVEDLWQRASGGNPGYKGLMKRLEFLPNSPTLMNRGTGKGTLSACFKFTVADSMLDGPNSIMAVAHKAASVAKWGGGVGYYLGNIRPKMSPIQSTHRVACGPISVMKFYNEIGCTLITQGGRRELAQMGILPVYHADIREFIHVKDSDPQKLKSFNISVSIPNSFMEQVLKPDPNRESKLFDEIIDSAWRTGDPGLFFSDRVELDNPSPEFGLLDGTNPCVTGDTLILTRCGWKRIDRYVGDFVDVWNGHEWSAVQVKITGRNQPVVRVTLDNGCYLDCTPYHGFYLADGERVLASDLREGDALEKMVLSELTLSNQPDHQIGFAYLAGFYQGDGFLNTERQQQQINFCGDAKIGVAKTLIDMVTLQSYCPVQDRVRGTLNVEVPSKGDVPLDWSLSDRLQWLAGLLDSDGSVCFSDKTHRSYSYQISNISHEFLRRVSLLLRSLGVVSSVGLMKPAERKVMPGGEYDCQDCFRICIPSGSVVHLIEMGLQTRRLFMGINEPNREASRFPRVVSVAPMGTVDTVYCFTEMKRGRGVFNGMLTAQCGEVPLLNNEACNLGSLNLGKFVDTDRRMIDWIKLKLAVQAAVRFLDDILDDNWFPSVEIAEAVRLTRKIGLGVMGWADMLAMLGIHYDTEEAIELAGNVSNFIRGWADEESIALAKEKGPYKEGSIFRNATRLCIAPTGSISFIANASSGIEPHYALEWTRKIHAGHENEYVVKEAIACLNRTPVGFTPNTAMEIPWQWHVRHQAEWQKRVDLAVSKTINLPNSATREDVKAAYIMMWQLGCKGGTVFRDKCRSGGEQVLESKVVTLEAKVVNEPIPVGIVVAQAKDGKFFDADRPVVMDYPAPENEFQAKAREVLNAWMDKLPKINDPGTPVYMGVRRRPPDEVKTLRKKIKVGKFKGYVHVGLYEDGTPCEVFLSCKGGSPIHGLVDSWAIAFSFALQHRADLQTLCEKFMGMTFEPNGMTGYKDIPVCTSVVDYVVRWMWMRFGNKKAQALPSGYICPDCNSTSVVFDGGCLKCPCGWSKCG